MVHRGNTREPKHLRESRISTLDEKLRRHRNKERIWRRAVARLTRGRVTTEGLTLLAQNNAPA